MNMIITGSARSGTSALCNLCSYLSGVFITNEMAFFHWWDTHDPNFLLNHKHNLNSSIHNFFNIRGLDSTLWIDHCLTNKYSGKESLCLLRQMTNSKVVGDKYPGYVIDSGSTKENVDKIFLTIRDPRAIIASRLREYNHTRQSWNVNTIKEAEKLWLTYFSYIKDIIQDDRSVIFTYESGVYDPVGTAMTVASSLEVPFKAIADFSHLYTPTNVDSWKMEFPDMNLLLSKEVAESILALGYTL